MKNKLSLFYDEYPSDFLQPNDNKNVFFGVLIHHKGIDENLMFTDNNQLNGYLNDPDLQCVPVCVKKTAVINKFLDYKPVSYNKSIYNNSNFVWCSVLGICFHNLYKSYYDNPLDYDVFYDPKSLNKDLRQEVETYSREELVNQVSAMIKKKIPPASIEAREGSKKMIGIRVADKKVREYYGSYPNLQKNNPKVKDMTDSMDDILENLLKKGSFSGNR